MPNPRCSRTHTHTRSSSCISFFVSAFHLTGMDSCWWTAVLLNATLWHIAPSLVTPQLDGLVCSGVELMPRLCDVRAIFIGCYSACLEVKMHSNIVRHFHSTPRHAEWLNWRTILTISSRSTYTYNCKRLTMVMICQQIDSPASNKVGSIACKCSIAHAACQHILWIIGLKVPAIKECVIQMYLSFICFVACGIAETWQINPLSLLVFIRNPKRYLPAYTPSSPQCYCF